MSDEKKLRGVYEWPPGSDTWWIQYFANGRRHREKVGKKSWAVKRYQVRKVEILEGRFFPPQGCSIEKLVELAFDDYRINKQNLEPIETSWKRLKPFFGARSSECITTEDLREYLSKQSAAGYSNGSLNRDMALLKRSFHLALEMTPPKVSRPPVFPARLKEAPPRSGFIDEKQYRQLLDRIGEPWLRAFLAIAYRFGLRKQEILDLRVHQVEENLIRLRPGETKNDEGRVIPLTAEIRELLSPCVQGKMRTDLVLTRGRRPVRDFRDCWEKLTAAAGVPELLPHDLRRSAVRNMVNGGIPEKVAMAISGHKTRAVFDRYNIVAEGDILKAGLKLEKSLSPSATKTATSKTGRKGHRAGKVISIRASVG